jgi:hypothetical protein
MSAPNPEPYSQKDKVTILLHEYNMLRAEILTRTTHGFQLMAVYAVLFVWIMQAKEGVRFWLSLAVAVGTLFIASWISFSNINRCVKRVLELEKDINSRAGENLLVWETQQKRKFVGFLRKPRPAPENISPACVGKKEPSGDNK